MIKLGLISFVKLLNLKKKERKREICKYFIYFEKFNQKIEENKIRSIKNRFHKGKELEDGEGRRQNFIIPAKFYTGFPS